MKLYNNTHVTNCRYILIFILTITTNSKATYYGTPPLGHHPGYSHSSFPSPRYYPGHPYPPFLPLGYHPVTHSHQPFRTQYPHQRCNPFPYSTLVEAIKKLTHQVRELNDRNDTYHIVNE